MLNYLYKAFFHNQYQKILNIRQQAIRQQLQNFQHYLSHAARCAFGQAHGLHNLHVPNLHVSGQVVGLDGKWTELYRQFQQCLPVMDYESLVPYIDRIFQGEKNVLWPGRPRYFAKTSGTLSGAKFIPITRHSLAKQIAAAKYTLVAHAVRQRDYSFMQHKLIFLTGSPKLDRSRSVPVGRLSGIVNHHVPKIFRRRQKPSWHTNSIEDWEQKMAQIVAETKDADMGLISGIPPWIVMYFEMLLAKTQAHDICSLFPNLKLLVHGGVNIAPYLPILQQYLGRELTMLETFPASEGFIAFEDSGEEEGLLLNTDGGIFFEFLPVADVGKPGARRYGLWEVQLGVQYALILNSNAGLGGYLLGDTVRFVHLQPYKILVTGRVGQFLSTFGEHVIVEEIERAMEQTMHLLQVRVLEFSVTAWVGTAGSSCYEWYLEFAEPSPMPLAKIAELLDAKLCAQNAYYADLRAGNMLSLPRVYQLNTGAFREYMKSLGKLGGQNKVPRLKADRDMALFLQNFVICHSHSS